MLTVLYSGHLQLSAGQQSASYQGVAGGPGLCCTGVSSLFTAIIWMLQRPLSSLWQQLYRSSFPLEY